MRIAFFARAICTNDRRYCFRVWSRDAYSLLLTALPDLLCRTLYDINIFVDIRLDAALAGKYNYGPAETFNILHASL